MQESSDIVTFKIHILLHFTVFLYKILAIIKIQAKWSFMVRAKVIHSVRVRVRVRVRVAVRVRDRLRVRVRVRV